MQSIAGLGAGILPAWTQAAPNLLAPSIGLDYAISGVRSGVTMSAHGALRWQRNAKAYEAHLSMVAFIVFKREQVSTGELLGPILRPRHFEDRKRRIQVADFSAERGRVRYGSGAERDWPAQGQDRVSMLMALGPLLTQALLAGHSQITLPVSGGDNWSVWQFDIQGRETVSTPSGPWPAWRLERSDAGAAQQATRLWLAPSLHHLPVRLLMREANGDTADQQLSAHRLLDDLASL